MNTLRQSLEEYLDLRRRLGFKLRDPGQQLPHFVRFMERRRAPYITQALALEWAQQCSSTNPAHWAQRLRFVRGFARHRSATDPRTEIPVEGLLPHRFKRARPYPYTEAEIRDLMRAALTLPPRGSLRPWTYYNLIGLLSVSGLRFGEACNLELRDVDLREGILSIRNGKFGKSRLVPLHPSTCEQLAGYLARRKRFLAGRPCTYFFTSLAGTRLPDAATHKTFRALTRSIGLGISEPWRPAKLLHPR
jgi:integrase/recombinase XerD